MRKLTGSVISIKMEKTAVVAVRRQKVHPVYKKRLWLVKKYHVHDEVGVSVGDRVEFAEIKPISKTKKWKILKVSDVKSKVNKKKKEKKQK